MDHINLKDGLSPLADHFQLVYYDQRGHGRSDASTPEFWNLPTWASDLRQLIDALGLDKPVVLGSSFGGRVVLTYACLFPGILAGEDDPICPLPVVEDLASRLPPDSTSLVRLPGARHHIFRDRPDLAFPAVEDFVRRVNGRRPDPAGSRALHSPSCERN